MLPNWGRIHPQDFPSAGFLFFHHLLKGSHVMKNDDTTPAIRLTRLIQRHEQDRECFFKHDLDDLDSVKHRLNKPSRSMLKP